MPVVILYLLKVSISLAIVWLFYQACLRRLTFYNLNRWYLLGYSLLSWFIPLIDISPIVDSDPVRQPLVIRFIPAIGEMTTNGVMTGIVTTTTAAEPVSGWTWVSVGVIAGVLIFLVRFSIKWLSLRRVRRHARVLGYDGMRIYEVDEYIIPFSFGNAIYINRSLHSEKELEEIILHEYVHIRQQHTIDMLLAEFLCILCWYNPFAWMIRSSIRQNLEFIADHQVLEQGLDKKKYQYHLLKVIGQPRYKLANNFNFSSLKKRIVMMNTIRSARVHLVKFLFILPLMAVLLVAFRHKVEGMFHSHANIFLNSVGIVIDMNSHHPLEGVVVRDKISGMSTKTDDRGYYRLHIPFERDSIRVALEMIKAGYKADNGEAMYKNTRVTRSMVNVSMMVRDGEKPAVILVPPYMGPDPSPDPGYEEMAGFMKAVIGQTDDVKTYMNLYEAHPEIALFYSTEDLQKQIVVLTNGTVEKYGYGMGPGFDVLQQKYGQLPSQIWSSKQVADRGYLDKWAAISAEAERTFDWRKSGLLKAVIFPGDSRVIAVPFKGKPAIYDMDNDDPKERPAFEQLYGPLPDCVPRQSTATVTFQTGKKATFGFLDEHGERTEVAADSICAQFNLTNDAGDQMATLVVGTDRDGKFTAKVNGVTINAATGYMPLFVFDGVPAKRIPERIYIRYIYSIDVLKPGVAVELFGTKGKNGAIVCTTRKKMEPTAADLRLAGSRDGVDLAKAIYYVNGVETPLEKVQQLEGDDLQHISVLKGALDTAAYGAKSKYGVVQVWTKRKIGGTGYVTSSNDTMYTYFHKL